MKECCETCRLKLRIEKLDYSKGGCTHTRPEGYICLAFRDEGKACWMVGEPAERGMCECYTPKEIEDAAPQWIRVEDDLPESGEFAKIVLACNDVGTVNAAFLSSRGKWYAANNTMYDAWSWMPNVTHWMPLPEPPKEVQE